MVETKFSSHRRPVINWLVILLSFHLLVPPVAQPQDEADGPPMLVIKRGWAKVRYRPDWDKSPSDIRNPNPNPIPNSSTPDTAPGRRRRIPRVIEQYSYRATLKNVSGKTAVLIGWDYGFAEAAPDQTTHHPFLSKIKIKPGQQREVRGVAQAPPTRTVNAGEADKGVNGEVIVSYVEYADGTTWRRR